jgi:purine-binding chemotaxis protein CheW
MERNPCRSGDAEPACHMNEQERNKTAQLVCFMLAGEEYAVDIARVREVIRVQQLTPVPQCPSYVLGVVNIRGTIVPVFDLRKKFCLPDRPFDDRTKLIVLNYGDAMAAVVVDEVRDTVKLDGSRIDPSPRVKLKMRRACIRGLGMLDGRMIIILDVERVCDEIGWEAGGGSAPGRADAMPQAAGAAPGEAHA